MIELNQLSFRYSSGICGVADLEIEIKTGECVVLCGKSGCGKTTFTRVLNGLVPELYEGTFFGTGSLEELVINQNPIDEFARKVGSVFQNPKTQFFTNDVVSELVFGCENLGVFREEIESRLQDVRELFPIEHLLEKSMHELSGGEKQLIAFASSYMIHPDYLVLDEPSSNLDFQTIQLLKMQLMKLKALGKTIILSEHRLYYLKEIADRYLYLADGKLIHDFSAAEMKAMTESELAELGLRKLTIQGTSELPIKEQGNAAIETLLFKNIRCQYGRKEPAILAIDELALTNQEIIGLVGRNGAGKSTFVKMASGLLKSMTGKVYLGNQLLTKRELIDQSYLVMQDVNYQLFCETVKKELLLNAKEPELLEEIVANFDLAPLLARHPMSLSGGQKQRLAIGTAILSGKKVIFLDEPTSGLDAYHMNQVCYYLQKLHKQGLLIVIISHDIEFLRQICDRILYLAERGVKADFNVKKNPEYLQAIFEEGNKESGFSIF